MASKFSLETALRDYFPNESEEIQDIKSYRSIIRELRSYGIKKRKAIKIIYSDKNVWPDLMEDYSIEEIAEKTAVLYFAYMEKLSRSIPHAKEVSMYIKGERNPFDIISAHTHIKGFDEETYLQKTRERKRKKAEKREKLVLT